MHFPDNQYLYIALMTVMNVTLGELEVALIYHYNLGIDGRQPAFASFIVYTLIRLFYCAAMIAAGAIIIDSFAPPISFAFIIYFANAMTWLLEDSAAADA